MSVEIDEAALKVAADAGEGSYFTKHKFIIAPDDRRREAYSAAIRAYLSHQGDARAEYPEAELSNLSVELKAAEADCARLREALKEAGTALASSIEAMAAAMNSGADFADVMHRSATAQVVVAAALLATDPSAADD